MKKRIFSLDLIRCLAMLGIVWFHFYQAFNGPARIYISGANVTLGSQAVTVFFILSGLMAGRSVLKEDESLPFWKQLLTYYKKRWWRIFPAFYIAYAMAMVIQKVNPAYVLTPRIMFTLFGVDGYLQIGGIEAPYLVGEWFLGCLIIIYLAAPFIVKLIRKFPVPSAIVLALIYAAAVLFIPMARPKETSVLVRGFDFFLGVYIGLYIREAKWFLALPSLAIWPVLWLVKIPIPADFVDTLLGLATFFVLWYAGALLGSEIRKKDAADSGETKEWHWWDPRRFVRFLADISYEVFLLHHVIIFRLQWDLSAESFLRGLALFLFVLVETILFAAVLHFSVAALRKYAEKRSKDAREHRHS